VFELTFEESGESFEESEKPCVRAYARMPINITTAITVNATGNFFA
jgi:hypothetical protein